MELIVPILDLDQSILDSKHEKQIFIYEDKANALKNIIGVTCEELTKDNRICIVANEKELEEIEQTLSSYGLLPICSSTRIIGKKEILTAEQIETIQARKLEFENAIVNAHKRLQHHVIPKMNIINIADQIALNPEAFDFQIPLTIPDKKDDYYNSKIIAITAAEARYSYNYQLIEQQDPFDFVVIAKYALVDLLELISHFIAQINDLKKRANSLHQHLKKDVLVNNLNRKEFFYKQLLEFKSVQQEFYLTNEIASQKALKQRLINLGNDLGISEVNINNPLNINEVVLTSLSVKGQQHGHENEFSKLNPLYQEIDKLQDDIEECRIFKNFKKSKAAGLEINLKLLDRLKIELQEGHNFIEQNNNYFDWKMFFTQLQKDEQDIISNLTKQDQSWTECFKFSFFIKVVEESLSISFPITKVCELYQDETGLYEQSYIDRILNKYIGKVDDFIYPITLMDLSFYKSFIEKRKAEVTYLFVNVLPDKTSVDGSKFFIGTNEAFEKAVVKFCKANPDYISHYKNERFVRNIKAFNHLNTFDLNTSARYLGDALHTMKSVYRLFQLKNVSIISMLSDLKNLQILTALKDEGVKEIMTDSKASNLLPALISNLDNYRVLLIEDGLIDFNNAQSVYGQMRLLKMLKQSGMNVISFYNYDVMKSGNLDIDSFVSLIRSHNRK